ncbi:hypothetical protein BX616_003621 [Lobosporangium transversale]|uniref:C2H2-type domain-containing protein n=1 Tax=Lobosporangium transversale TaxID=64571 RepID=A0A1Y2GCH7_9FUNG|nr:hypothetical protein BCR41DRAFT_360472 [Lobosporangium transversale]KAF9898777.1 hypothetical protein BX616_003621 [Lobosporangium transversale]ORZ07003.1 hypothetical protein BCR41DRAFT_360472 [Lobosporangium transversale]|eukprot:XP_021877799.1 hypothetical protein BCR41DRAFT_360472 [Lobosporangium transversale]
MAVLKWSRSTSSPSKDFVCLESDNSSDHAQKISLLLNSEVHEPNGDPSHHLTIQSSKAPVKEAKKANKSYSCPICNRKTSRSIDFERHYQTHLSKEKRRVWICDRCGTKCFRPDTLKRHRDTKICKKKASQLASQLPRQLQGIQQLHPYIGYQDNVDRFNQYGQLSSAGPSQEPVLASMPSAIPQGPHLQSNHVMLDSTLLPFMGSYPVHPWVPTPIVTSQGYSQPDHARFNPTHNQLGFTGGNQGQDWMLYADQWNQSL